MPQQRLTDRVITPYITGDTLIHIVNTGDTTQYSGGSSYKATINQVATYISQNFGNTEYWTSGSSGTSSIKAINSTSVDATGNRAVAWGNGTLASGENSHAEGGLSVASGDNSHAEGFGTIASGYGAHAEGRGTIALGENSHAEGRNSYAEGIRSHAEGDSTIASGTSSHAEGNTTIASGEISHAEGLSTTASGDNSHAEGYGTIASGFTSHVEGGGSIAGGDYSHAEGGATLAIGNYSHSEGYETTASGNYSHAEGYTTIANGNYSHSSGYLSVSNGDISYAGGYLSTANGLISFIHSTNSLVSGNRSVVIGGQNITGTTDDTVYVPYLNISLIGGGVPNFNLGLDSNGFVVTGTTSTNFSGGTVPGETIFSSGLSATTISATTIGSSGDCVDDLYVSNIHSCSPLNINPLDEGNVYFGSTSAVTIDLLNNSIGISAPTPTAKLHINNTTSGNTFLAEDSTNPDSSPFVIDSIGRVGIGTTGLTSFLTVNAPASASTNESIARFRVGDGGNSYFAIDNAVATDNVFVPGLVGRQDASTNQIALIAGGYIDTTQDSGTTPVTVFRSAKADLTTVSTRPLFDFRNWTTSVMRIAASGNVGVGIETPSEKLDVSGKTKTINFQMTSGATNGYVLTSDASGNASWSSLYNKSTINISSATILGTLSAGSPVQLLPAPSLGKYYDWHAFVRYSYGTIAYNNSAGGYWYIEQGGADLSYGFNLNAITTNRTWKATEGSGAAELIGPSGFETSAINIRLGAATTNGDGTISVDIYYRELDL